MKTEAEVNLLVKKICDAGGFPASDLEHFDVRREIWCLDTAHESQ